jgi:gliding motility-associated-like protein
VHFAVPWFQPNTWAGDVYTSCSSDYFIFCSTDTYSSVPANFFGYQQPRTGAGYAGITFYDNTIANTGREYLEIMLSDSLNPGEIIHVCFYVSLAEISKYGIDKLGAYFAKDSVLYNDVLATYLNLTPQIQNSNGIISDRENWVKISGSFVAAGGERFMVIGNFHPDNAASKDSINSLYSVAYYYIDDVYVGLTSCDTILLTPPTESSFTIPNVFTPNGDGINDVFVIQSTSIESLSCEIFNRWGVKVATISRIGESWDGRTTSGQEAIEGVYYYVITARDGAGNEIRKAGYVQLFR